MPILIWAQMKVILRNVKISTHVGKSSLVRPQALQPALEVTHSTAHPERELASDPPWLADQIPGAIRLPDRGPWGMSSLANGLHVGTAEGRKWLAYRSEGSPRCGHRAKLCPMLRRSRHSLWRALTLPTAKGPNSEVSNFLQVPEVLTWLSNVTGDLEKIKSTGGKGKEIKSMQMVGETGKKITKGFLREPLTIQLHPCPKADSPDLSSNTEFRTPCPPKYPRASQKLRTLASNPAGRSSLLKPAPPPMDPRPQQSPAHPSTRRPVPS